MRMAQLHLLHVLHSVLAAPSAMPRAALPDASECKLFAHASSAKLATSCGDAFTATSMVVRPSSLPEPILRFYRQQYRLGSRNEEASSEKRVLCREEVKCDGRTPLIGRSTPSA